MRGLLLGFFIVLLAPAVSRSQQVIARVPDCIALILEEPLWDIANGLPPFCHRIWFHPQTFEACVETCCMVAGS